MRTCLFRSFSALVLAVFAMTSFGCYCWVDIKPMELPKLNGSYSRVTGVVATPSGQVATVESTVAHLEKPDGTLVEIGGEYDAEITTSYGPTRFSHPVNSSLQGDQLVVQGGNRAATGFPLQDVRQVQVSQYDRTATTFAAAGGGIVLGLVLYFALTSSMR